MKQVESVGPPPSKVTPGWMAIIEVVTTNEPCWSIEELNLRGRRYQIIVVNRNDHLAACYRDLGAPRNELKNSLPREFAWLCGFDHSVAEALDWADEQREDMYWKQFLTEKEQTSTLVEDLLLQKQQVADYVRTHTRTLKAARSARSQI